eukprot:TRINITY_DN488_c0_g1_i1.p1 TRINITY_DN488_c0_g1~~TRINITY_DN488_c0_g1_i1.p1  ORF type:complete len:179 (+),score=46.09 TRINITY_DN488_c0_g1_i1:366-902(+)
MAETTGGKENTWMAGVIVVVKTVQGDVFEGEIFTYDSASNCVVLLENQTNNNTTPHRNLRLLNTNYVKEVNVISKSDKEEIKLHAIDLNIIKAREEQATRQQQLDAAKLGVGVSTLTQNIFNALSKTLPCKWSGDVIIVMDDVRISPPYKLDNVSGGNRASVARVQKVLEGERRKLGQ